MSFVERKASSSKSAGGTARKTVPKGGKVQRIKANAARRQKFNDDLKDLQTRIDAFDEVEDVETFSQLPLSQATLKGLKSSHFVNPTTIQSQSIPPSLRGRDILGSAKTGSGKTLAFLIPLLERLYHLKWGPLDGLGAVVISPTRELAVQTFMQLRDIGKFHNFSAGLVIGGKALAEERARLGRMNILVATPGRLLQHLDSTVGFDSAGVKMLVLDEADRLLDMGFLPALRAIVTHFAPTRAPNGTPDRQTLLFSATQSKDLASLAKLSLHDPLYINCNKPGEEGVVPSQLEQFYTVINLDRKLDALWGFVKTHLKMKGLVFVTSGKQVRFIFETFRRLHPGLPVLHLHGKQKQHTRLDIFQRFGSAKSALLICTDVAARGLDFPAVDWVIQLDCPEDAETYIHRVGRTARYQSEGKGLCMLLPSEEEGMLKRWKEKGIEVKRIKIKESKMGNLRTSMQNFAFKEPEIKYLGQRAFISYMRSVHFQKDKTIFKLDELPAEDYAASLGLPGAPYIKFQENRAGKAKSRGGEKQDAAEAVAQSREIVGSSDEEDEAGEEDGISPGEASDDDEETEEPVSPAEHPAAVNGASDQSDSDSEDAPKKPTVRTKYDRMFERKNQDILTSHYSALVAQEDGDGDDDVFTLARRDHDLGEYEAPLDDTSTSIAKAGSSTKPAPLVTSEDLSKRKLKAGTSRKGQLKNRPAPDKVVFDDVTGEARNFYEEGREAETGAGAAEARNAYLDEERDRMQVADQVDREVARERRRERKRKRKEREKDMLADDAYDEEGGAVAYIGGGDDDERGASRSPETEPVARSEKKRRKDQRAAPADVDDEEALALRLLQGA